MEAIGTVKFVQIQRSPMKLVVDASTVYTADPLMRVAELMISGDGIRGLRANKDEILDVHHRKHERSRYRGDNKISLNFSSHYHHIRQYFGDHIIEGCGGENIIFESDHDFNDYLSGYRILLENQQTKSLMEFEQVIPATPCHAFGSYCLQVAQSQGRMKSALQFLSKGMRGYYAGLSLADEPCRVQAGDRLLVVPS